MDYRLIKLASELFVISILDTQYFEISILEVFARAIIKHR